MHYSFLFVYGKLKHSYRYQITNIDFCCFLNACIAYCSECIFLLLKRQSIFFFSSLFFFFFRFYIYFFTNQHCRYAFSWFYYLIGLCVRKNFGLHSYIVLSFSILPLYLFLVALNF